MREIFPRRTHKWDRQKTVIREAKRPPNVALAQTIEVEEVRTDTNKTSQLSTNKPNEIPDANTNNPKKKLPRRALLGGGNQTKK